MLYVYVNVTHSRPDQSHCQPRRWKEGLAQSCMGPVSNDTGQSHEGNHHVQLCQQIGGSPFCDQNQLTYTSIMFDSPHDCVKLLKGKHSKTVNIFRLGWAIESHTHTFRIGIYEKSYLITCTTC